MHLDVRAIADSIGYPLAGLGVLIESLGLPFPGELTLLGAAAYAAAGRLDIRVVALIGGLSAVFASDLGYLAGYRGGRPFVERFSHLVHVNPGHLARSEMFFTRYGGRTILFGRFVLGLRTWACVLAGMAHMPFWTFQAYSAAGALLWAVLVGAAGFYLGSNWTRLQELAQTAGLGGLVVLAFLILAALLLRRRAWRSGP
jgi:membrane protein DedA with SNARE-associated domain